MKLRFRAIGDIYIRLVGCYYVIASYLKYNDPYLLGSFLETFVGSLYLIFVNIIIYFEMIIGVLCVLFSEFSAVRSLVLLYTILMLLLLGVALGAGYSEFTGIMGAIIIGNIWYDLIRSICILTLLYLGFSSSSLDRKALQAEY